MWPQKSILDGVTVGTTKRADAHDPAVANADEEIHKPVQRTVILAQAACIDLHVTDCKTDQVDLKHLLGDDTNTEKGNTILWEQKKLTLYQGALSPRHTPTGKLEES